MMSFVHSLLRSTVVRYAIAGGTASVIDIVLLYTFTDIVGMYYLFSALVGTTISFFARFFLQKLFAFRDRSVHLLPRQIVTYGLLYVWGTVSTLGLLYLFTEVVGWWYIASQVAAILTVACVSFFIYRYIVFPASHAETPHQ
jgi:dolichol-phosphate mannosyltransferase